MCVCVSMRVSECFARKRASQRREAIDARKQNTNSFRDEKENRENESSVFVFASMREEGREKRDAEMG